MALVVNTNITALIAQANLKKNTFSVQQSMTELSSGLRINSAADDAAGLTIAKNLQGQIQGNQQALQNSQDGTSILQITEGALNTIGNDMQRIRQLVVQAGNGTNSQQQLNAIAQEIGARAADIDRIANSTSFNGIGLLSGSAIAAGSCRLQIGANSPVATNTLDIASALATCTCSALGFYSGNYGAVATAIASAGNVWDPTGSQTIASFTNLISGDVARVFLSAIDVSINNITGRLSQIGAYENQLQSVQSNLQSSITNFTASNSRIMDADVASASSTLVQNQVLQQAAVTVLSQANQTPQLALTLLKNA